MLPESIYNHVVYACGGDFQPGASMKLSDGIYCVSNDGGRIGCTYFPTLPLEREIEIEAKGRNTYPHLVDSAGWRKCQDYSQTNKCSVRLSDVPQSAETDWELY